MKQIMMNTVRKAMAIFAALFAFTFTAFADNVAKIGTTEYATLDAALGAVKSGETIEIVKGGEYTVQNLGGSNYTIDATGADGVVTFTRTAGGWVAGCDNVTVKGLTWDVKQADYQMFKGVNAVDCTFVGLICTLSKTTFKNCVFRPAGENKYCVNCYSSDDTFENCTFDTDGKAIFCYGDGANKETGATTGPWTINVKDCTFKSTTKRKVAVFVKTLHDMQYIVNINDCTLDGTNWPKDKNERATDEQQYPMGANGLWGIEGNDTGLVKVSLNGTQVYPAPKNFYQDAQGVWHISNLDGLKEFRTSCINKVNYEGKTVQLDADIDLGNEEWTPIPATYAQDDTAVFNGNGKTISNLKVTDETKKDLALFGSACGWLIKDLTVDGAVVTGKGRVAALVGQGRCVKVEGCTVKNAVITAAVYDDDDGDKAAAVVAYLSGENVAWVKNCLVENCSITGYRDVGGAVGYSGHDNATVIVSGTTVKNTRICNVQDPNPENYISDAQFDVHEVVGHVEDGSTIENNTATDVTVGVAVAKIGNVVYTDLAAAIAAADGKNVTVELIADVDLGGAAWTAAKMNNATFDGKGHKVSNFTVTGEFAVGFFGNADCSTIKNLTIENATVSGVNHVGAVAGRGMCTKIENCAAINCSVTTSVKNNDDGDKAGAIVGYLSAETKAWVKDCTVDGCTVTGYRDVGGAVGIANGAAEVSGCTVKNTTVINDRSINYKNYTTDAEFHVNKVVGEITANATVKDNTENNVTVGVAVAKIGSVVYTDLATAIAAADGKNVTVELLADVDLGGAAWTAAKMNNATFDGKGHKVSNFTVTGEFAVGFFGNADCSTIKNLTIENATVKGVNHVGAVAGRGMCTKIENCAAINCSVTTSVKNNDDGDKAGAIVGYLSAETKAWVKDCTVDGCTVTGYRDVGGAVGIANGAAEVSGCTVKNTTVNTDCSVNYKDYTSTADFHVNAVVGEITSKATVTGNTTSNVTVTYPTVVAKIGAAEYYSLAAAIAAVEAGETIVMQANVDLGATTITVDEAFTLDLNGKKISAENTGNYSVFYVKTGGDVTIDDSSTGATGSIESTIGASATGTTIYLDGGKLTLNKGAVKSVGTTSGLHFAIDVKPNEWGSAHPQATEFVMNGGYVYCEGDEAVRVSSSSALTFVPHPKATINGGTIEGWDALFIQEQNATYHPITVAITGGTFIGTKAAVRIYGGACTDVVGDKDIPVDLQVSGGTFTSGKQSWSSVVTSVADAIAFQMPAESQKYAKVAITGGTYPAEPVAPYLVNGYVATQAGDVWNVGLYINTGDDDKPNPAQVVTKPSDSSVQTTSLPQEIASDEDLIEAIETSTEVEGVKLTTASVVTQGVTVPAGVQSVVDAAKDAAVEAANEDFTEKIATAEKVEIKVDVKVTPTAYVEPAEATKAKIAFKLTPEATVKIIENDTVKAQQVVPVTNDMIDQDQKITVSLYTGFTPKTVIHIDEDGSVIETFTENDVAYDSTTGVTTVQISHFSDVIVTDDEPVVSVNGTYYTTLSAAFTAVHSLAKKGQVASAIVNIYKDIEEESTRDFYNFGGLVVVITVADGAEVNFSCEDGGTILCDMGQLTLNGAFKAPDFELSTYDVTFNGSVKFDTITGNYFEIYSTAYVVCQEFNLKNGADLYMVSGTLVATDGIENLGTIHIDLSGATGSPLKVIDYTGSSTLTLASYGTIELIYNNANYFAKVVDSDLYVAKGVAQIGDVKYETLAEAYTAAAEIAEKPVTIDVLVSEIALGSVPSNVKLVGKTDKDGKPATVATSVSADSGKANVTLENFVFNTEVGIQATDATIKNCRFAGTGDALRWCYAYGTFTVDGCEFAQSGQYGINFDGGSGVLIVKNSKITGTVAIHSTLSDVQFIDCEFAGRNGGIAEGKCNINIYGNKAEFTTCTFAPVYADTTASSRGILMLGDNTVVELTSCSVTESGTLTDVFRRDYVQVGVVDGTKTASGYTGGTFVGSDAKIAAVLDPNLKPVVKSGSDGKVYTLAEKEDNWIDWASYVYATPIDETTKTVTIASAAEFGLFAKQVNNGTTYAGYKVILAGDIDLAAHYWIPATTFKGTFDGQNKTIAGLKITGAGNLGLFGSASDATFKNVTISGATVKGTGNWVAALVGNGLRCTVSNVTVTGCTVSTEGEYAAGIVGGAYTDVSDSSVIDSQITGKEQVGGVVGYSCGQEINGNTVSGVTVTATAERAGLLVGKYQATSDGGTSTVLNNVVQGTVVAPTSAGGLLGQLMGENDAGLTTFAISGNEIDATLPTTGTTNPIGVLRDGLKTAFTSLLAERITGNWWEDTTLAAGSYQYTNVGEGVDPQTIYRGVAMIGTTTYKTLASAVEAATAGQTVTLLCDCAGNGISINKSLTIDFGGFTYTMNGDPTGSTGTETQAFQLLAGNTIVFKNGTITSTTAKMLVQNYSNLTLTGMTLDGSNLADTSKTAYTLSNNAGETTIGAGTKIIARSENGVAFDCFYWPDGGYAGGVSVAVAAGATITGPIEYAHDGTDAAHFAEKAVVTKDASVEIAAPTGYVWKDGVLRAVVAKIGDVGYATLADAVTAATAGQTVTLLANATGNGISINKSLTIDFGGFTYTMNGDPTGSTGTETQAFQLLAGNTIVFKNGTVTSTTAKMLVQNYSNLTLTDMTLDGSKLADTSKTAYTLSNNAGVTTIGAGTTIIARSEKGVAFDCFYWPDGGYTDGVSVAVAAGATVNGAIEYAHDGTDAAHFAEKAVVTKDPSVSIAAPADYKWDATGKLVAKVYVAQIGETKYESINDAFAAVSSQSGDDVTIKVLRSFTEELTDDYTFTKNVTLTSDVEGGVTMNLGFAYGKSCLGLVENGGSFVLGENVAVTGLAQLFAGYGKGGTVDLYGDVTLQQLWAYDGGIVNIHPTAKVVGEYGDGMVKLRYDSTINVEGTGTAEVQFQAGYFAGDKDGAKTLFLSNTYATAEWLTNEGLDSSFTLNLDSAKLALTGALNFGADATGTINMNVGSLISAATISNVNAINIDATGLAGAVKVIDYTGTGTMTLASYGTVNVTNGYEAYVEDNDLWVKLLTSYVQIGTVKYAQMADAVTSVTETPVDMSVVGSGNLGTKETTAGEGSEFTIAGTYNIGGTEWANIGYLQFNPNKVEAGMRYVMNVGTTGTGANLVMTKPQLRRLSDLNITDSHVDFALQPNNSKGYLFAFCDSTVNLKNSVVGYYNGNGTSASVVAGQESTGSTDGMMATYISGTFTAEGSTVFTMTTDASINSFAIYDKGLATFKDSVLYAGYVTIGDHESSRSDRWTVGRDGEVATIELDNSKIIKNLADAYAFIVGDDKTGKLIMKNGSLVDFTGANATVNANGSIEIDATSQIKCNAIANAGTISINATDLTGAVKVIDVTGDQAMTLADFGTVNVIGSSVAYVDGNDLYVKPAVAKIGDTNYGTLAAALKAAESGATIEVLNGTWDADAIGTIDSADVRVKSLTIQPAEGATVKFTSTVYLGADDGNTANATMTVKNLAFENATLKISNYVQATVEGCTFKNTTDTAGTLIVQDSCCKSHKSSGDYPVSQVTVKNCTIDGSNTDTPGIRLRNTGNVLVTGCTIKNSMHNGILFESNAYVDNTVAKTVTVTGNTITDWNATNVAGGGRAIRANFGANDSLASGSTVTIEGNVFTKATLGNDEPDFIKITAAGTATTSLENNNWNNELSGTVSGNAAYYTVNGATPAVTTTISTKTAVAQVGTAKYENLATALNATTAGKTCELLCNVDMAGKSWTPIANFVGTFDGKGYTISNLSITGTGDYTGFFELLNGTVKNVTFDGCSVTKVSGQRVGVLAGATDSSTVQNVTVKNSNVEGIQKCAGLIGFVRGGGTISVTDCTVMNVSISENGTENGGVWQSGGLIGFIGSGTAATIASNTVSNITIVDAYKKLQEEEPGSYRQYTSHAFIGVVVNAANSASAYATKTITLLDNETTQCPETQVYRDVKYSEFIGEYANWDRAISSGNLYPTKLVVDDVEITKPYAKIGDTYYLTLADAVAAATANQTVTLLANATGDGIQINKSVTIDFGGFTYDMNGDPTGSVGTETQAFQLLAGNTVVFTNGTVTSTKAKMLVQNYANFTAADMMFDGTKSAACNYVVSNNNGQFNAVGGTSISANTGATAFDICATDYYPNGVTVTIDTAGTITGNIEYDVWGTKPTDNKAKLNFVNGTVVGGWVVEDALKEDAKKNLNVSGGTFSTEIPKDYCAPWFVPKQNPDGTWGVAKASVILNNVKGVQRYPWNGLVDITFTLCTKQAVKLYVAGYDALGDTLGISKIKVVTDSGEQEVDLSEGGFDGAVTGDDGDAYHVIWDSNAETSTKTKGEKLEGVTFKVMAK